MCNVTLVSYRKSEVVKYVTLKTKCFIQNDHQDVWSATRKSMCSSHRTIHSFVLTGEDDGRECLTDNLETCFVVGNGLEYFASQPSFFVCESK
jgi:hypothetical protein